MRVVRAALIYIGFVGAGVVGGQIVAWIVAVLASLTNLARIAEVVLPADVVTWAIIWIGNAIFLVVFGFSVGAGFTYVSPKASDESAFVAGLSAAAVGLALLLAPLLLLRPLLVFIDTATPEGSAFLTDGNLGTLVFVYGAYALLGGLAGLLAGLVYAGLATAKTAP